MTVRDKVLIRPYYIAVVIRTNVTIQEQDPRCPKKYPADPRRSSGIVVVDPTGSLSTRTDCGYGSQSNLLIKQGVFFEKYLEDTSCLMALIGFMQEVVALPLDRVLAYQRSSGPVTALAEFGSVAMHAIHRFDLIAHQRKVRFDF